MKHYGIETGVEYDQIKRGYYIYNDNNVSIYKITSCNEKECRYINFKINIVSLGNKAVRLSPGKFTSQWKGVNWITPISGKKAKEIIISNIFKTDSTFEFDVQPSYLKRFLAGY
jgi:hypothetical protein